MKCLGGVAEQLRAHLDSLGDGNIFALYPKILEEIFLRQEKQRENEPRTEWETAVLPSDMEWRLKAYFKLVQQQRDTDDQSETEASALDKLRTARRYSRADSVTDPWTSLIETDSSRRQSLKSPYASRSSSIVAGMRGIFGIVETLKTPTSSNMTADSASSSTYSSPVQNLSSYNGPPWGPSDVGKAARLLEKPPLPVNFEDDQEMRRVYSLIYDVFRYKGIFEDALNEISFYGACPEALKRRNMAWLLLLDQQRRGWAKRECSKNSLLILRMRDSQESMISNRKLSHGSDASNASDFSVGEDLGRTSRKSSIDARDATSKDTGKSKREISSETRELIRKAREQLDKTTGSILPILEDPKPVAKLEKIPCATDLKLPNIDRKGQPLMCQTDNVDGTRSRKQSFQSENKVVRNEVPISKKDDSIYTIKSSYASDSKEITLEEIRSMLRTSAGEIGETLLKMDDVLWNKRIKIAAAIAKIRITNKALSLAELLPPHLRDGRISVKSDCGIVSGWVNVIKIRGISDLMQRLNEMGYGFSATKELEEQQFFLDKYCPRFISVRPCERKRFMKSALMKENMIVPEEKEFCMGVASICKAVKDAQLQGDIVQTHGTSPKAVAYLASLLREQGPEAGGVVVFGVGHRKPEYDSVLKSLEITNARVFAEPAAEASGGYWATAVAALAPPPNSFSAVQDPIDLVCSRGGDLSMLEDLTESQINNDGKRRVMQILEEQKNTLKLCMSKPQIQMIVYETHSILSTENSEMVKRAIAEANRDVREIHAMRRQKLKDGMPKAPKCAQKVESEQMETDIDSTFTKVLDEMEKRKGLKIEEGNPKEGKSESKETPRSDDRPSSRKKDLLVPYKPNVDIVDPDTEFVDVPVPDCDLFQEILPSPLAGLSRKEREGCYIALIQRKEIIKLNAKYMIQIAETRGLFGGNSPPPRRYQTSKTKMVKEEKIKEIKRRLSESQIERIAAPTYAWSLYISSCRFPYNNEAITSSSSEYGDTERSAVESVQQCENCIKHHAPPTPRARLWWRLAIEAYKKDLPLRLPRRRIALPIHSKIMKNKGLPEEILHNYIAYKRGTKRPIVIKKSTPQIMLSELKKYVKKNKYRLIAQFEQDLE